LKLFQIQCHGTEDLKITGFDVRR